MNLFECLRKKLKSNKGSVMITVVVIVTFISVLGTVLLYMVSSNYQMKVADVKTKQSFYGAEEVLEIFKAQLVIDASEASTKSFYNNICNYSLYAGISRKLEVSPDPADIKELNKQLSVFQQDYTDGFRDEFTELLSKRIIKTDGAVDYENTIKSMFPGALNVTPGVNADGNAIVTFDYKDMKVTIDSFNWNTPYIAEYDLITPIQISVRSKDGYTSIIKTSLIVMPPAIDMSFEKSGNFFKDNIKDCVYFTDWEKL